MAALVACGVAGGVWLRHSLETTLPSVPQPDLVSSLFDTTPVTVVFTVGGLKVPWHTTADDIRSNLTLWRSMHLAEWNDVPESLRREGLDRMLERYRSVLANPPVWDRMDADDWDGVPQPVRTVAYRNMVAYWAGYYKVGVKYGLQSGAVADTLAAVVMTESWFEHR
ncbi:MAG: hypothetical protein ACRD3J_13050, partial [Thermoanaerobaculia bacterium]